MSRLTHVDEAGDVRMVDVGEKPETHRIATARGRVRMASETLRLVESDGLAKGDVLAAARIAGIQAAKETSRIVPLCHPISLTHVAVNLTFEPDAIAVEARVETRGRTGVEMEALTAVTAAALTLYDMAKGIDRTMVIEAIRVVEKEGGTRGEGYTDPLARNP